MLQCIAEALPILLEQLVSKEPLGWCLLQHGESLGGGKRQVIAAGGHLEGLLRGDKLGGELDGCLAKEEEQLGGERVRVLRHDAVDLLGKMCEDCNLKHPVFGLPGEKTRRWCASCAKQHPGAADLANKKCEDCKMTQPKYGLPGERKGSWCASSTSTSTASTWSARPPPLQGASLQSSEPCT